MHWIEGDSYILQYIALYEFYRRRFIILQYNIKC